MPCTAKRQIEIDNPKEHEATGIAECIHDADLIWAREEVRPQGGRGTAEGGGGGITLSTAKNPKLLPRAKEMRKNMTKEECHLWFDYLRNYKPRFKRQRIVGNYILDFYCEQARLAVEADGSQHYEAKGMSYDGERDLYLLNQGIMVLRFSNRDIWERFEGVKIQIDTEVRKRWHPLTTASRSPAPKEADNGADNRG